MQQRTGARGLQRILTQTQADELIYVGRLLPGGPIPEMETLHRAPRREPGGGVLVGVQQTDGSLPAFATELKQLADANKIPFASDYSANILPRSYLPMPQFPTKWAHIGIATSFPDTPAETLDWSDLLNLTKLLGSLCRGFAIRAFSRKQNARPEKRLYRSRAFAEHGGPSRIGGSLRRQLSRSACP